MRDLIERSDAGELLQMAIEDSWELDYANDRFLEIPSIHLPEWIPCTEDTKLDEPKECWVTMSDGKVRRLYYRPKFAPFPWTSMLGMFTHGNKDIVAYIPIEEPKPYQG